MKRMMVAMSAVLPAMVMAMGVATAGSQEEEAQTRALNLEQSRAVHPQNAAVTQTPPALTVPSDARPLNQIDNVSEQVATARVIDTHGQVVGAVQKVEIQNGRPTRVDIALLAGNSLLTLDAATLRYDAATNVVVTGETLSQLMARSHT